MQNFIVTGAAGGMGSAAVKLLAARGSRVVAVDLDADRLADLAQKLAGSPGVVHTAVADVGAAEDIEGCVSWIVDEWGGLDGIFQIAAILGTFSRTCDAPEDNYDRVLAVNAKSVWLGMKYAIPALIERGGGVIVNTGSHASERGSRGLGAYAAAKHAVVGLSRTAALEYAEHNVRVNIVCPSAMDTQMGRAVRVAANPDNPAASYKRQIENSPSGRLSEPEEPAAVGVWMLTEAPAHVNGVVVHVDAGRAVV